MARRTKEVTVTAEGRDKGKVFLLTEMPSSQGEKWAMRALLAIANSGQDVPPEVIGEGMAGIICFGFRGLLGVKSETEAEPLMDALMQCVQRREEAAVRPLEEEDIEEVETRIFLKAEVFNLHTGFSLTDAVSQLLQWAASVIILDTQNTGTSPVPSAPSSPAAT